MNIHSGFARAGAFFPSPYPEYTQRLENNKITTYDNLPMTRQLGYALEDVVVFGVKPKNISCGLELSKEIAASVPKVVELVLAEIAK
jgi:Ni,Fe-hydrogenase maturation factor